MRAKINERSRRCDRARVCHLSVFFPSIYTPAWYVQRLYSLHSSDDFIKSIATPLILDWKISHFILTRQVQLSNTEELVQITKVELIRAGGDRGWCGGDSTVRIYSGVRLDPHSSSIRLTAQHD